nr:MAG TPA: hypothetical protein [Caudoviricetes sp.]
MLLKQRAKQHKMSEKKAEFKANSKEAIESKIKRLYEVLKNNASMKIEHFESVYRQISILTTKLNNLR